MCVQTSRCPTPVFSGSALPSFLSSRPERPAFSAARLPSAGRGEEGPWRTSQPHPSRCDQTDQQRPSLFLSSPPAPPAFSPPRPPTSPRADAPPPHPPQPPPH